MKGFSTSRGRYILGGRKQMKIIYSKALSKTNNHSSRYSRRSSKSNSSASSKSDKIKGTWRTAYTGSLFRKGPASRKMKQKD